MRLCFQGNEQLTVDRLQKSKAIYCYIDQFIIARRKQTKLVICLLSQYSEVQITSLKYLPLRAVAAWLPVVSSVPHLVVAVWPTGHSAVASAFLLDPERDLCLINQPLLRMFGNTKLFIPTKVNVSFKLYSCWGFS